MEERWGGVRALYKCEIRVISHRAVIIYDNYGKITSMRAFETSFAPIVAPKIFIRPQNGVSSQIYSL